MTGLMLARRGMAGRKPTPAPMTIANLTAWWRPESGITLAGGAVSGWADQSGNGVTLGQNTASQRPSLGAMTQNGIPLLGFSAASSQLLSSSASALAAAANMFTLIAVANINSATGNYTIAGFGSGSGGRQWRIAAGKQNLLKASTASMGSSATAMTAGTTAIVTLTYDGSTLRFFRNGAADGTSTSTQTFVGTGTTVGIHPNFAGEAFDGYLGGILVYSRALTTGELAQVDTYLSDKYAITVADHL